MKKIIVLLLMGALALPFALPVLAETAPTPTLTSAQEERIASPDEIKNYTNVHKVGDALYGYRKPVQTANGIEEKITSPSEIRYFSHIRKVGTALYGIRIMNKIASTTPLTAEQIACVQTALEKRDTAVISARDVLNSEIKTALQARMSAFKNAIAITNPKERAAALMNASKAFKTAKTAANNKYKAAIKTVSGTFKTDVKACNAGLNQDVDTLKADSEL